MPAHEFESGLDTPAFVTADESGQLGQQVWRWHEIVVGDVAPCAVFIELDFIVRNQLGRAPRSGSITPESRAACPVVQCQATTSHTHCPLADASAPSANDTLSQAFPKRAASNVIRRRQTWPTIQTN